MISASNQDRATGRELLASNGAQMYAATALSREQTREVCKPLRRPAATLAVAHGVVISRGCRIGHDVGWTGSTGKSDTYTVAADLSGCESHSGFCNDRHFVFPARNPGDVYILDRRYQWRTSFNGAMETVTFDIPHATLRTVAGDVELTSAGLVPGLICPGKPDQTMHHLALVAERIFDFSEEAFGLFANHLAAIAADHVTRHYAIAPEFRGSAQGGLARWQERRAKEMIVANLDGSITIADLARACRLSVSHFNRAFKSSAGCSPHKWLVERRVELAKQLISSTPLPLSDIALSAGFADQSHMTRVFSKYLNTSPAAWRRGLRRDELRL